MSLGYFLAVDKPLQKTVYPYKDILPTIEVGDMFYGDKISFVSELTDTEKETLGNVFNDFNVYAIYTGFKFIYAPRLKKDLSVRAARSALEELLWLKSFAKKKLSKQDVFMILPLWLGRKSVIKSEIIDVNNWKLDENTAFDFECGTIYQFIDNSEEAVLRRKSRAANMN